MLVRKANSEWRPWPEQSDWGLHFLPWTRSLNNYEVYGYKTNCTSLFQLIQIDHHLKIWFSCFLMLKESIIASLFIPNTFKLNIAVTRGIRKVRSMASYFHNVLIKCSQIIQFWKLEFNDYLMVCFLLKKDLACMCHYGKTKNAYRVYVLLYL